MITARLVKKYLKPGDIVFIHEDGQVKEQRIKKILADSLAVEDGFLSFEEHGISWWLTKKIAEKTLR